MAPNQQLVTVSLGELKTGICPPTLGILIVKELPANFQPLHIELLSVASYLAKLSPEQLDLLINPVAHYNWSNIRRPECLLPGFRETFGELCTMIIDITLLVAKACDQFAVEFVESMTIRARLLYYFLPSEPSLGVDEEGVSCTFEPVPFFHQSPDPLPGIYIRSRTPEVVKVNAPSDCVTFQTGSALGKMTGGALKDVPPVFTQPNLEEVVDLKTGMTFGELSGSLTRSMPRRRENLGLQMFK
ncbi:uncharacterized protein K444DRAFT_639326 [Hyaloscypha bicolor E]|uniref:Uncharacterized protein n=1 Tax=Hyaloscypha bicolor E TaxID=1095630 RepID=A0A2J6TWC3_9HELO|nr:uncharacterized protein K444DRAFT_639326 [Hyaloscypha bicolor E]PMD67332.1 hypothetical protein K444DRAFT_639326 [Hyaloscypha bicolor E]